MSHRSLSKAFINFDDKLSISKVKTQQRASWSGWEASGAKWSKKVDQSDQDFTKVEGLILVFHLTRQENKWNVFCSVTKDMVFLLQSQYPQTIATLPNKKHPLITE